MGNALHEEIHEDVSDEEHKHEFGCENESIHIIYKRWHKLEKDILNKDGIFESSKIPDIYDMIKYDMLHNFEFVGDFAEPLFDKIQVLSSVVSPLEFGADPQTKIEIGVCIASPLLQKIHTDLLWWKTPNYLISHPDFEDENENWVEKGLDSSNPQIQVKSAWRHVRTRLYFTHASHMHSVLNILKFGMDTDFEDKAKLNEINNLDYLSHITFTLHEDLNALELDD